MTAYETAIKDAMYEGLLRRSELKQIDLTHFDNLVHIMSSDTERDILRSLSKEEDHMTPAFAAFKYLYDANRYTNRSKLINWINENGSVALASVANIEFALFLMKERGSNSSYSDIARN